MQFLRPAHLSLPLLSYLIASLTVITFFLGDVPAVTAFPVSAIDHGTLIARSCPTVADILPVLRHGGLGENTVFYTSPAKGEQAENFAMSLTPRGQCFPTLATANQEKAWYDQCEQLAPGENVKDERWALVPRISQALAEGATGTAYVLIYPGVPIENPNSVWGDIEFPALKRNPEVTQIIRVNPDNVREQAVAWTP